MYCQNVKCWWHRIASVRADHEGVGRAETGSWESLISIYPADRSIQPPDHRRLCDLAPVPRQVRFSRSQRKYKISLSRPVTLFSFHQIAYRCNSPVRHTCKPILLIFCVSFYGVNFFLRCAFKDQWILLRLLMRNAIVMFANAGNLLLWRNYSQKYQGHGYEKSSFIVFELSYISYANKVNLFSSSRLWIAFISQITDPTKWMSCKSTHILKGPSIYVIW